MGESELIRDLRSEAELVDFAGRVGAAWLHARRRPLVVGLRGALGSGKTSWVRALLRGLGYAGRVPSPTYTLLEHYALSESPAPAGPVAPPAPARGVAAAPAAGAAPAALDVLHLDLYRLAGEDELENLGIRDWLAAADAWLFVEWVERAPQLARRADLEIAFELTGPTSRRLAMRAQNDTGNRALEDCRRIYSSNEA